MGVVFVVASGEAKPKDLQPRFVVAQPNASSAPTQPEENEPPLDSELTWRAEAMRDEHRVIPPGAFYRANIFRQRQLASQLSVTASSLGTAPVQGMEMVDTGTWTSRGPQNVGGRTRALLIDPTSPSTMYAGAVSGGIWKSTDSGGHWQFQSSSTANLAIMSMAFDPTVADRSVIYASTGERGKSPGPLLRGDGIAGSGILKSTDHGVTWLPLASTTSWDFVPRVAVSRTGYLIAAARGGIYYCDNTDCASGNAQWVHAYTTDANGAALTVAYDPNNGQNAVASVLDYDFTAGTWRQKILFSRNAGLQWGTSNMPSDRSLTDYYGDHIELAYAKSQSGLVYADVSMSGGALNAGEIWQSTDGGINFAHVTQSGVTQCTGAACAIWVSPTDSKLIVTGGYGPMARSTDGGVTFTVLGQWATLSGGVHADQHVIVEPPSFSSSNPKVYVGTDGGIFSNDNITTVVSFINNWTALNIGYQTGQYHGADGNVNSGDFVGGTQDNGTLLTTTTTADASPVAGSDGGLVAIDPTDPLLYVYGETQFLDLFRWRVGDPLDDVVYIGSNDGPKPLTDVDDPFGSRQTAAFVAPFTLDPRFTTSMVAAGLRVWRSSDIRTATPTWDVIRNAGTGYVISLAIARTNPDVIWVVEGSPDGTIAKSCVGTTCNGTSIPATWATVRNEYTTTDGLPQRPATSVYIDPDDYQTVYLAFGAWDGKSLFRTTNGGASWVALNGAGLTALPPCPARAVVRHPRNKNVLFVGTDVGIYESDDGGSTWAPTTAGPADASVYDLKFVYGTDQLLVATHGRGLWTLDTTAVLSYAPTALTATWSSANSRVDLQWNAYTGATSYQVLRSSNGLSGFSILASGLTANSYHDPSVASGKTYLYRVRAQTSAGLTGLSNVDLATTMSFLRDNGLSGQPIVTQDVTDVRSAVNDVLTAANLPVLSFGSLTPGTPVQASDVNVLRDALARAYYSIGMPMPTFEPLAPGVTPVKAIHVQQLRDLTK